MNHYAIIIALLSAVTVWRCTSPLSTPGSSDHGNGYAHVHGTLRRNNGDPATDARVLLLPDNFNGAIDSVASHRQVAFTDRDGNFFFDSIPFGRYCLSGKDTWSGEMFVKKAVAIQRDTIDAGVTTLSIPGTVYFNIDSLGIAPGLVLFYPGLPLFTIVDSARIQWINNVPSGTVMLKGYDRDAATTVDLGIEYLLLELEPGFSVFLPYRMTRPWVVLDDLTLVAALDGVVGMRYRFCAINPAHRAHGPYRYRFSWGDGVISAWTEDYYAEYAWSKPGVYAVQAQMSGETSCLAFSEAITVIIRQEGTQNER
jgi:hypothetical protein